MGALKELTGGEVDFAGIGGERMAEQGLNSLFPMEELSIMGLAEILPRARHLLRRIAETADTAQRLSPDVMVTIDAPGFSFRVGRRLPDRRFPLIHYVAPTVWAWRPGRARKIAQFLDHLLVLLPFEPPYFEREGLPATFVGHPIIETAAGTGDGARFRAEHGIPADARLLCVLPGSRRTEVTKLLPVFGETVRLLAEARPGLRVVVPTVAGVEQQVRAAVDQWPGNPVVFRGDQVKHDAFAASDAALAASGTVALELAMARLPSVIAYKVQPLTAWIARRLIKVRYANLVNIILDRPAVPEFLQDDCRPALLAPAVLKLIDDPAESAAQRQAAAEAVRSLGQGGTPPSARAAAVVLEVVRAGRAKKGG
jgi:lipid-A-disaccharide synthase